jgi:hypothetical protein
MHSLNDLRVLLSDPFTQAHILESLKEDQFKFSDQNLERKMKLTTAKDKNDSDHEGDEKNDLNDL